MAEQQKERFSRAFVVAVAASAAEDYTYVIYPDDIEGVDMSVRHNGIVVDFQLKATAHPNSNDTHFLFDLDVPTYHALADKTRSGLGVLTLVVIHTNPNRWVSICDTSTTLTHCAYYVVLTGKPPTLNSATVRIQIPKSNRLTPAAMNMLIASARARFS